MVMPYENKPITDDRIRPDIVPFKRPKPKFEKTKSKGFLAWVARLIGKGGYHMRLVTGPPELNINCRCSMAYSNYEVKEDDPS